MPKDSAKDDMKQGLKDLGERMSGLGIGADPAAAAADEPGYRLPRPEPSSTSRRTAGSMTKEELYAEAKRLDVKDRSQMTKAELAKAVQKH